MMQEGFPVGVRCSGMRVISGRMMSAYRSAIATMGFCSVIHVCMFSKGYRAETAKKHSSAVLRHVKNVSL